MIELLILLYPVVFFTDLAYIWFPFALVMALQFMLLDGAVMYKNDKNNLVIDQYAALSGRAPPKC